jgi:hypothetical protein
MRPSHGLATRAALEAVSTRLAQGPRVVDLMELVEDRWQLKAQSASVFSCDGAASIRK